MEHTVYAIYMQALLGKVPLENAKNEIIEQSLRFFLEKEFNELLQDTTRSTPEELSEIFKDMNGWTNEDFVQKKQNTLEALLFIPSWFNLQGEFIHHYNRCLIERWHHNHEHILAVISFIKSETSTAFIDTALNLELKYLLLDSSNYESYVRKCMWALADINTPESIEILHKYKNDASEVKRQYADEQIRWLNGEKGMRYMP